MREHPSIQEYRYSGVLADECKHFIAEKRAVGYLYNSEAKKLSEFSRFTDAFEIPPHTLPEEVVKAWIALKPTDSDRNRYARFSLLKQFAEYMQRLGFVAYCPEVDEIGKLHRTFIPYIFTHEEIRRFFAAADAMKLARHSIAPRRHLVMPVLFRMLYCCGLRVSEATQLRGKDVDLAEGVITICNAKFGKTRYVPMSAELMAVCAKYNETRLVAKQGEDWFFAAPDGRHYGDKAIYCVFRDLLYEAGISHGGRGYGPRLHDLRHTFAVHCLQNWIAKGAELSTALPRLTAYLGHNNFESTEQYLRMTAEVYPEISALMQEQYGYVIPTMEVTGG